MSTTTATQQSDYILRRCEACNEVNRVVLTLALHARCGQCGSALRLSYYDVLTLTEAATDDEIKIAYRRMVLRWHPDRLPEDQQANARFRVILDAYRILYDSQSREHYNRVLLPGIHLAPAAQLREPTPYQATRHTKPQTDKDMQRKADTDAIVFPAEPILYLLATTAVMLFGILFWIMTGPHDPGLTANLPLWGALFVGAAGLIRFLFSLAGLQEN